MINKTTTTAVNSSHIDSAKDIEPGQSGSERHAGQLSMPVHFFYLLLPHVNKQELRGHGRLVRFDPAIRMKQCRRQALM